MPTWPDDKPTVEAADAAELRAWLAEHHDVLDAAWFRYWKVGSGRPSLAWTEVVDELLCWGWIDSKSQAVDADSHVQYIARRKRGSVWSRINRDKVERLIAADRMTPAGLAVVEAARADGSWTLLVPAEDGVVPDDLAAAMDSYPGARAMFESLTDSQRTELLRRIYLAKRAATREKWVTESARRLAAGDRPPY